MLWAQPTAVVWITNAYVATLVILNSVWFELQLPYDCHGTTSPADFS